MQERWVKIGKNEYRVEFETAECVWETGKKCPKCGEEMVSDEIREVKEIINTEKMTLIPVNSPLGKRVLKVAGEDLFKDKLVCLKCFKMDLPDF